jgi:hypothetical protein
MIGFGVMKNFFFWRLTALSMCSRLSSGLSALSNSGLLFA